jgi:4-amino-4-deoxy-L-arabinose transferase-like glycosyltransferase
MVWLALALWAYAVRWRAKDRREALAGAAGFGLSLGLAFLTKYAALYFAGAAVLHALLSRETRRGWRTAELALAIGLFLIVAAPNAIWNATHHFQTLSHTAANADLGEDGERHDLLDLRGGPGYIVGQFGVFGPLAFTAFVGGAILAWRTKRLETTDILLLLFTAPPLLIVLVEAVVSRANANWAGAAYGPAAILAAAFLLRWRARRMAAAILVSQGLLAAIFLGVFARPVLADRLGFANSFKRARGWAATAQMIETAARDAGTPLCAIAADDRFLFNAMAYYARSRDGTPAAALGAPLRMWVREAVAHNQAETAAPLDANFGGRVLVANATPHYRREIIADFQRIAPTLILAKVRLDKTHDRTIALFVAEDFRRQPRDPRTGRPFRP